MLNQKPFYLTLIEYSKCRPSPPSFLAPFYYLTKLGVGLHGMRYRKQDSLLLENTRDIRYGGLGQCDTPKRYRHIEARLYQR